MSTETLTEMFDRIIKSIWKQGAQPDGLHWVWDSSVSTPKPIGIETSVQARLQDAPIDRGATDASTDVNLFIRSQTNVKRRAFDKGALARGGVIARPEPRRWKYPVGR